MKNREIFELIIKIIKVLEFEGLNINSINKISYLLNIEPKLIIHKYLGWLGKNGQPRCIFSNIYFDNIILTLDEERNKVDINYEGSYKDVNQKIKRVNFGELTYEFHLSSSSIEWNIDEDELISELNKYIKFIEHN